MIALIIPREARDAGTRSIWTEWYQDRPQETHTPHILPDPIYDTLAEGPYGQRPPRQQISFDVNPWLWQGDTFVYGRVFYRQGISAPQGRQLAWRERANIPVPVETSYGQLISQLRGDR